MLDHEAGTEPHRVVRDMFGNPYAGVFGERGEEINGGIWNIREEEEVRTCTLPVAGAGTARYCWIYVIQIASL